MVRLEITGGHASALDGMQWGGEAGRRAVVVMMVERKRSARGTCLVVGREEGGEQGLTIEWNTMCRRQRMSQSVRVGITREVAGGRCVSQQRVDERSGGGGCKAWRERGKVGFSEWKGRSAVRCGVVGGVSDRLVTTTRCTNTRLHCTRVMEVLMGGGEAVVGQTDKTVVGNGAH